MTILKHALITTISASLMFGCSTPFGDKVAAVQSSPVTQAVEKTLLTVGASLAGQPELAFLAGPATTSVTWAVNSITKQPNALAISGTDVQGDAQKVATAIVTAIPTSQAKTVAAQVATAYQTIMNAPGVTPNVANGNAALVIISNALTAGTQKAMAATPN